MNYWLLKSEPDVWSIDQQKKAGIKGAPWDGVRNYQAAKNLKSMKKGDLCFFYHSNIGKEIVGIVEVIKTAFIDPTDKDKRFVAVQVSFKKALDKPVSLDDIRKNENILVEVKNLNGEIVKINLRYLEKNVIDYEPILALDGGLEGLSEIRKVINKSSELIKTNGILILEIGFDQKEKVKKSCP